MLQSIQYQFKNMFQTRIQSQNGRRKTYLDMVKGICIILVVLGHSEYVSHYTNIWLSTFHLPAFFIVSGYLTEMKMEFQKNFREILIKKVRSLLVPYFIFSFGALLVELALGHGTKDLISEILLKTIFLRGYSVFWFLSAAFFGELIFIAFRKKLQLKAALPVLVLIAVVLYKVYDLASLPDPANIVLQTIAKFFIAAAFMAMGALICRIIAKREKFSAIELVAGLLLVVGNYFLIRFTALGTYNRDLNFASVGSVIIYLLQGTIVSMGLFLVCKNIKNIPIITFFGQNSLIIMSTHLNYYVLYCGYLLYKKINPPMIFGETFAVNFYSVLLTMIMEIFIIVIINCFFPFVLGKRRRE